MKFAMDSKLGGTVNPEMNFFIIFVETEDSWWWNTHGMKLNQNLYLQVLFSKIVPQAWNKGNYQKEVRSHTILSSTEWLWSTSELQTGKRKFDPKMYPGCYSRRYTKTIAHNT